MFHDVGGLTTTSADYKSFVGKKVAEVNYEAIRELSLYSYRIIYEVTPQLAEVLAIVHKRMDFKVQDLT